MADFQYTTVPGKLKQLLSKVREVGVPPKASNSWLKTVGFKSSNDSSLLTVLRFIGFISGGAPSDKWIAYRGKDHGQVLANAIREGYSDLYAVYPDAHSRSADDLEHVFGTHSKAGKQVIDKTVRTFKSLCELAEFSAVGVEAPATPSEDDRADGTPSATPPVRNQVQPSLHIDIQVHISPDATTEQIDQIFESMAKHLYKGGDSE